MGGERRESGREGGEKGHCRSGGEERVGGRLIEMREEDG